MDAATFRQTLPEFTDTVKYPSGSIDFWLSLGTKLLPSDRWSDLLDQGLALYTAHHLVIATRDQQTEEIGGLPGEVTGAQTSASVDKVSASFDTGSVTHEGAGFWNMTSYGVRFYNLVRIVGAGGIQL